MFKVNIEQQKFQKGSFYNNNYANPFVKCQEGYHNVDSPLKTKFRIDQVSPRKSLSPLKLNSQSRNTNVNRSKSPILFSKQSNNNNNNYLSNKKVSPLKRIDSKTYEDQYTQQSKSKNISFTSLIRKNSNQQQQYTPGGYQSNLQSKCTLDYSTTSNYSNYSNYSTQNIQNIQNAQNAQNGGNYLQSDRNFREDTNLFRKLANMLESNKSNTNNNNKSFLNSNCGMSENSVKFKVMPQSCKNYSNNNANNNGSNKKVFIRNVETVESIQSPQQRDFIEEAKCYSQITNTNIQTKCYSEYERFTTQCSDVIVKKGSTHQKQRQRQKNDFNNLNNSNNLKMQKKASNKYLEEEEIHTFKKINLPPTTNENNQNQGNQQQQQGKPIDFHLTNSFGTTVNLKNQIIGQNRARKACIKPFQQINDVDLDSQVKQSEQSNSVVNPSSNNKLNELDKVGNKILKPLNQSQDSLFSSLHMLLSKIDSKQVSNEIHKQSESINISLMSENESFDLDMEPFLQKRK